MMSSAPNPPSMMSSPAPPLRTLSPAFSGDRVEVAAARDVLYVGADVVTAGAVVVLDPPSLGLPSSVRVSAAPLNA